MKSVINAKSISKHTIQKYNFKILTSSTFNEEKKQQKEEIEEKKDIESIPNNVIDNEVSKEVKDDFIAELLEKSDKMSTELIKLQMQIEEGQKEFEKRIVQAKEESYSLGIEDGYKKAKQEHETEIDTLRKQYINSISKLNETIGKYENHIDNLKNELSDVSLEIAKEVIAKEVSQNSKEIALALAKKLLEDIKDANSIEIKVNPKNFEYLKESFSNIQNILISQDEAISEGGVILMSNIGNIDGDIKTRIEKVKQLIMVQ